MAMKKRDFLKRTAQASAGLIATSGISMDAIAGKARLKSPLTAEERRRARFLNLPVVTHDGKTVRFYDDLLKGKTVLINFMFSRCNDNCPMTTVNLKKVYAELGGRVGKDLFMYSLSLDPEHDSPAKLNAYAKHFKTGPGWLFLTGTKSHMEQLRVNLGFKDSNPEVDKDKSQHLGLVKFGIEPLERWGMAPTLTSPAAIAAYVDWLDPNGGRPSLAMLQGHFVDPGNIQPGDDLFAKLASS